MKTILRLLSCLLLALLATTPLRADAVAYQKIVDLEAKGDSFVVRHHHDWSRATLDARFRMITTHQDPFQADNTYAWIAFYGRDGKTLIRRSPSPALTWLKVTPDSRYVVGLSNLQLDNPYHLVVYDRNGELLLKRHIAPGVACMKPAAYQALRHKYPAQLDLLRDRAWIAHGTVYVDYFWMDMPKRLGPAWTELSNASCPSPLSPNFSESVTNWIFWYDEDDPAPQVIERDGKPVTLRLKDPKGVWMEVPFHLEPVP